MNWKKDYISIYPHVNCVTGSCFVFLCILYTFSKRHIYFLKKDKKLKMLSQMRKTFKGTHQAFQPGKLEDSGITAT